MKILCVCNEGNVRSVAMAYVLKYQGHDAIAIGIYRISPESLKVFCDWADKVYLAEPYDNELIPDDKRVLTELGPDVWGYEKIQDLIRLLKTYSLFKKQ